MQERNIQALKWMDEIIENIPSFFSDKETLKLHIDAFVRWSDIEWYNIAFFLYQKPDAVLLRSIMAWNRIINEEFYPKKGERGIKVLIPYIKENHLSWMYSSIFDVSQCQNKIDITFCSNLKLCLDEINNEKLYGMINDFDQWIEKLTDKSMRYVYNHIRESSIINEVVQDTIKYVLNNYMPIPHFKEFNFPIEQFEKEQLIYIYKSLKDVIENLPDTILMEFSEMMLKQKERESIERALRISRMNIRERIQSAQLIINTKIIETQRPKNEEDDYDLPEPTGMSMKAGGFI